MAGPENRVEAGFARWCRERGLFCVKLMGASLVGFPDRTVLLPGAKVIFIEFKSPAGKTSKMQDRVIAALRALGFPVLVTSDKAEAMSFTIGHIDASRS